LQTATFCTSSFFCFIGNLTVNSDNSISAITCTVYEEISLIMGGKITFFMFGASGAPVRQVNVSKASLVCIAFLAMGCMTAAGFGIYDYYQLKKTVIDNRHLERKTESQIYEIALQRKQIQSFAKEVNALKSKIVALNDFEKRIRIIAGIAPSDKQKGIFGVGGSTPEDLNAKIPLTEKHNTLVREMNDQVEQLDLASVVQEESFESLMKHLIDQGNLLAHTPAIRPARGMVTSKFGNRVSPFTGQSEFHEGLDIANSHGTPVVAAADGVVTFADVKSAWGNMIMVSHGHGMVSCYAHLSRFLKKTGDKVKRGEIIGEIGATGRTTGPHLHYEVRLNGTPVNPEKYILN